MRRGVATLDDVTEPEVSSGGRPGVWVALGLGVGVLAGVLAGLLRSPRVADRPPSGAAGPATGGTGRAAAG
jgi:hypothetical protein